MSCLWVCISELLLANSKCVLIELLCLRVVTSFLGEIPQAIQGIRQVRVVGRECMFIDGKRLLVCSFCLSIVSLQKLNQSQVIERFRGIGVLKTNCLFIKRKDPLV